MKKKRLLLVEDKPDIAELILYHLEKEHYEVVHAEDGEQALSLLKQQTFDLIVLDLMLPKMSGNMVLEKIKNDPLLKNIPVIIESARGDDADIILGLDLGAEDYVTKPFSPKVLLARIKKIFLRKESQDSSHFSFTMPQFSIDSSSREVRIDNKLIELTAIEFDLLLCLVANQGKVMSREKILQNVWMDEVYVIDRVVDVHINALRKKLGSISQWIETVRGIGYKFRPDK